MLDYVEDKSENYNDLQIRLFDFSVKIIQESRRLPLGIEYKVILNQLIKSVTSSAANYEEAQAGVSKNDFSNKIGISLKEMRESNYWLRLVIAITEKADAWIGLEKESVELMKILGSIYSKTSKPRY